MSRTIEWLHDLPRLGPLDREVFLTDFCSNKRVIHLGFADNPVLQERLERGDWLHARLAAAAASLVGIDLADQDVAWAREHGFESYVANVCSEAELAALDLEPADVVLAGELIEHLDAAGLFLRAVRHLCRKDGRLVLTTPNATRMLTFLAPVVGKDFMHPDHVIPAHTPTTLRNLLSRNGWKPEEIGYYHNPLEPLPRDRGLKRLALGIAANAVEWTAGRLPRPYWCDGLIAVARFTEVVPTDPEFKGGPPSVPAAEREGQEFHSMRSAARWRSIRTQGSRG